jgi:DNA-directed RNA polymerase beta subunit
MSVCSKCGLTAVKKKNVLECKTCKTGQHIKEIAIPYATKLLCQELMAMQIAPRMMLDEIKENN